MCYNWYERECIPGNYNKLLPIMGEINNRKGAYVESKRIFENALKIKVIQPNNDI